MLELPAEPSELRPVSALRGTVLASSLQALTKHGHRERYDDLLDPAYREAIRDLVVRSWVPVDVALAHYTAANALPFTHTQRVQMGGAVGERLHASFLGTIVRAARRTARRFSL